MPDLTEYRGHDYYLDNDDGYHEWSETIEKQNQQQQDAEAVIGEHYSMDWDEVMTLQGNPDTQNQANPDDFQVINLSHLSWDQIIYRLTRGRG